MVLNVRMVIEYALASHFMKNSKWGVLWKKNPQEVILVVRATYNLLNLHDLKIIAFPHHLKERSNLLLKDWSENTSGI